MRPIATDDPVAWCVKKRWTDRGPIRSGYCWGPKTHCVRWGPEFPTARGEGVGGHIAHIRCGFCFKYLPTSIFSFRSTALSRVFCLVIVRLMFFESGTRSGTNICTCSVAVTYNVRPRSNNARLGSSSSSAQWWFDLRGTDGRPATDYGLYGRYRSCCFCDKRMEGCLHLLIWYAGQHLWFQKWKPLCIHDGVPVRNSL